LIISVSEHQQTMLLRGIAGVASFGVNTDYSAAGWACPFLLFAFQKFVHTVSLNIFEILNYA